MSPAKIAARIVPVIGDADAVGDLGGGVGERRADRGAVLRQAGQHVDRCDDADDPQPGGDEREGQRDPDVPEAVEQGVDGQPEHDRRGAEPGGPGDADALARTG